MARLCDNCGEKLFPTDTFCGFCGEPVKDAIVNIKNDLRAPRPIVGEGAISYEERRRVDLEKRRAQREIDARMAATYERRRKAAGSVSKKEDREMLEKKRARFLAEKAAREETDRKTSPEACAAEAETETAVNTSEEAEACAAVTEASADTVCPEEIVNDAAKTAGTEADITTPEEENTSDDDISSLIKKSEAVFAMDETSEDTSKTPYEEMDLEAVIKAKIASCTEDDYREAFGLDLSDFEIHFDNEQPKAEIIEEKEEETDINVVAEEETDSIIAFDEETISKTADNNKTDNADAVKLARLEAIKKLAEQVAKEEALIQGFDEEETKAFEEEILAAELEREAMRIADEEQASEYEQSSASDLEETDKDDTIGQTVEYEQSSASNLEETDKDDTNGQTVEYEQSGLSDLEETDKDDTNGQTLEYEQSSASDPEEIEEDDTEELLKLDGAAGDFLETVNDEEEQEEESAEDIQGDDSDYIINFGDNEHDDSYEEEYELEDDVWGDDSFLNYGDAKDHKSRILAAEERAKESQRAENRINRKRKIEDKPKHFVRDIIILLAAIAVLVALFIYILKDDIKDIKGNDAFNTPDISSENAVGGDYKPENKLPENYIPSDYDKEWDGSTALGFIEGEGSSTSPYIIKCGSELAYIAETVNSGNSLKGVYFRLGKDINLAGLEWTPIGYFMNKDEKNVVYPFSGIFDGGGFKITNLTISTLEGVNKLANHSDNITCGLFGAVMGAEIKKLTLEAVNIETQIETGEIVAGALAGSCINSTIADVAAGFAITATGDKKVCAGGIFGIITGGSLTNIDINGVMYASSERGNVDASLALGYAKNVKCDNITVKGELAVNAENDGYAGGFAGYADTVEAGKINASVKLTYESKSNNTSCAVGGLAGYVSGGSYKDITVDKGSVIINCTGTDSAILSAMLAGFVVNETVFSTAKVSGALETSCVFDNHTSGLFGVFRNSKASDFESDVSVKATATDTKKGNVIASGVASNADISELKNINTSGRIEVISSYNGYAGGVYGQVDAGKAENVKSGNEIVNNSKSGVSSGGIAGYIVTKPELTGVTGAAKRTNKGKNVYDDAEYGIVLK
ncbi:MAG: hypothetical protein PUB67_01350 [Clostridiales bacterium]|nr:hypothetical protein [Clostridiales bacterium]